MLRHSLPPALRLLTLAVVLLHLERAHPVLHGHTDDPDGLPLVALWGRDHSPASGVRCTGLFVAPESVLTSASCVLRVAPEGAVEDTACATGAPDCPVLAPEDLLVTRKQIDGDRGILVRVTGAAWVEAHVARHGSKYGYYTLS